MNEPTQQFPVQQGLWKLIAPDGTTYTSISPLHCVRAELNYRVPAHLQLDRLNQFLHDDGHTETITWHRLDQGAKTPDDDRTVLIFIPYEEDPVTLAFHHESEQNWRYLCGGKCGLKIIAWAEMPKGPDHDQ